MLCARLSPALLVVLGTLMLADPARAQDAGRLSNVTVPAGARDATAATDVRTAADRAHFLLEVVRRFHLLPPNPQGDPREPALHALLARLDRAAIAGDPADAVETLPLPLPAEIWNRAVFGGDATPHDLVSRILGSRNAALLYLALLSLDDETRAWLAAEPDLLAEIAARQAPVFVVAAPGLRITRDGVRVPGGQAAAPVWEALVGRSPGEPARFVRALLGAPEGRLAYFFAATAQLTHAQAQVALNLHAPDPSERIAAARRLLGVFARIASGWSVERRTFWRPTYDPALLAADLATDPQGRPVLLGTRRFWAAVFAQSGRSADDVAAAGRAGDPPVDFPWICEQIFRSQADEEHRRYRAVLFASRLAAPLTAASPRDAVQTLRAAMRYPVLVAALERAGLRDVAVMAHAARRAAELSTISNPAHAVRALSQYQGALAIAARARHRGSLPLEAFSSLVASLSDVELARDGSYEGRLVRWVDAQLRRQLGARGHARAESADRATARDGAAGPVEEDLLRLLAGPASMQEQVVAWEGRRYRVDLTSAEAHRLVRQIGEDPRPYLSSAVALVNMADALGEASGREAALRQHAAAFQEVALTVGWEDGGDWTPEILGRYGELAAAMRPDVRASTVDTRRLVQALCLLADELAARGLRELVYAAALGEPGRAQVTADDVATRHDLEVRAESVARTSPWQPATTGAGLSSSWRVSGSLLGLDVVLAEFSLVRVTAKPPPRKPALAHDHQRVLTESVALVDSTRLVDDDRAEIVAAIRRGRDRLAQARTPADVNALAEVIRLGTTRRSLLAWMVANDPDRVATFLSPAELLWLGLERKPVVGALDAWGTSAGSRLGCLCLQVAEPRPWEMLAGRTGSGVVASMFPDLSLRLAELLSELRMPSALLGPVLAAAVRDLIETVAWSDEAEGRTLVDYVHDLSIDRVEQYLALLTTDGPLVPIDEDTGSPILTGAVR